MKALWASVLLLFPAQDSIEELIRRLGADEFEVREDASGLLLKRGPEALPALDKAAKGERDPEILIRVASLREKISRQAAVMWHPVGEQWGESIYKRDVALSPDGRLLVSAYGDDRIRIWDPRAGRLRRLLPTNDLNHRLSFSPDGRFLNVFDYDEEHEVLACERLVIWDVEQGTRVATVHKGFQFALAPSGKSVARAAHEELFLVSIPEGKEREVYQDGTWPRAMVFSPDSRRLYIQEQDRIRVVDVAAAREIDAYAVDFDMEELNLLWMTPDGKTLMATLSGERGMGFVPRFRGEDRVAFMDVEKRALKEGPIPYRVCSRMDYLADPASVPFEHDRFEARDGYGRRAAFLRHREGGAVDAFINMGWSDDGSAAATIAPDGTLTFYEKGERHLHPEWNAHPRDVTWMLQHLGSENAGSYVVVRATAGDFVLSELRARISGDIRFFATLRRSFRIDARLHNPEGWEKKELVREYRMSAPNEEEALNLEPPHAKGERFLMLLELMPGEKEGVRCLLTLPHSEALEAALRK